MNKGEIKIYQSKDGSTNLQVQLEKDTIWLTQEQMSLLFGVNRPAVTKHVNNIFKSGELGEKAVCSKMEHTASDGKKYQTKFYNLDMVISVGYRVNSKQATDFRVWATSILKDHLIKGYSINQKRLEEKGLQDLESTLSIFKKTLGSGDLSQDEALGLLYIITKYTNSWVLLQKYDENDLQETGTTKSINYKLEGKEAFKSLLELKLDLIEKNQATELFANPREDAVLEGIFGTIYQTFDNKELYPSIEEKASNLLYFIVKNHPFSDGNKRSGAFLFILFLVKNNILFDSSGERKINDRALVAITLLIAESNPKDKKMMVKLVLNLIN